MTDSAAFMKQAAPPVEQELPPDWWPYAKELPQWHVWRGVSGLVYASRRRTSPPVVVRGEDAVDLRDMINRERSKMSEQRGRRVE
jgi:hypothetical protein